jgi:broad specificity phosphatase PhoE
MKLTSYSRHSKWLTGLSLFAVACTCLFVFSVGSHPAAGAVAAQDDFKPTTVFLVRHAERADAPREDPPLTEAGTARAQLLARILGKSGIKAIYTSQYLRTKATAEPLAKQLGIATVVISLKSSATPREVASESIQEIVDKIYARPGENVLVIGHGNSVPPVIKALGGDVVPTMDEKEFDDLFVVTVYAKGKARVTHLKY